MSRDTAKSLDRGGKSVKGASGKNYSYDVLIVALGSVTNFFGIKGLRQYAFGIKSNEEAQRLRDHLHKQLQDDHRPDINYVVIGGGATGVELAGALPGYIKHIMKRHGLDDRPVNVSVVEAEKRLVPRMRLSTRTLWLNVSEDWGLLSISIKKCWLKRLIH